MTAAELKPAVKRHPRRIIAGLEASHPTLTETVKSLTAEYPAFTFTTAITWHCRRSLVARPRKGTRTALFVVITSDPVEMRMTLAAERTPQDHIKSSPQ